MSSLDSLDLSNNQLSGGIPEQLAVGCSLLEFLALSNNKLQGKIFTPNFSLTNLMELQLDGNNFSGRIPDFLSNSSLLYALDVSNNQLSGTIPRWMGNMSILTKIIMSNNHLEGIIPVEFCHIDLKLVDLSVNNISGRLPSCFSPSRIRQVHLSKNRLRGSLPDSLGNSSTLVALDASDNFLTGSIPSWVGRLSNLSYLLLNNNKFEGRIPIELCNLSQLSLINLSHNNLSGPIPPCLKITALKDVSEDYVHVLIAAGPSSFSFEEPIEFTTKNVSYSYKGKILPYLCGIDLSFNNLNNLSGNIPPEFAVLHFLSYFNVSYNNLSGKTPERIGQLGAFDESSYLGNPFLCGTLVQKNCSPIEPPLTPKGSTGNNVEDGSIDMVVFYVSFIVSYIIVILSIAVVLYINPYWRQAWFYHVEMGVKSCYYFVVDNLPRQFL
ncbi:probable LRR receptor-like serine/threonine-protein kinase At4g36180 [Durio zibethinus]|uniref:Probable LRR receptor-like serine/threonine-protein kinase At4g36180 n=1 Tax=Durio zibethinus TaxID=66656 RepID=A0A6P5ZGV9_DURZI|nr:probable LRR receptor-like serine/threonine-protein kinase At4g36180 [Durio zibethinus]